MARSGLYLPSLASTVLHRNTVNGTLLVHTGRLARWSLFAFHDTTNFHLYLHPLKRDHESLSQSTVRYKPPARITERLTQWFTPELLARLRRWLS